MPYEVLRTPQVATALQRMSTRERRSYDAAREALRGEGCKAGGYRLAAAEIGGDYPLCCRHLTRAWRMFTAYPEEQRIVIVALDEHDRDHNPCRRAGSSASRPRDHRPAALGQATVLRGSRPAPRDERRTTRSPGGTWLNRRFRIHAEAKEQSLS
jgi:hypothetical protein